MKNYFLLPLAALMILAGSCQNKTARSSSESDSVTIIKEKGKKQKIFRYETVPGDSLKTRIYTLDNGLKVYLTDYENAPRIQTYVAVRAGIKSDPATATGLAHYLEHMLFKGTSRMGTTNWEKEKKELHLIESLYNAYRRTTAAPERRRIYHQIDSVSQIAAKYAIPNEFDKMMGSIGTKRVNAYTSLEQTVYMGDIPSNQIERWAKIEGERFRELVPRLFHTELEAVYEEKNRSLDSDEDKAYEVLFQGLFPTHPYGTQTTIGTIEHLKNPSITEIKKYYATYYVPNNMAICLSGDLDMDQTIRVIDQHFGGLKSRPVPEWNVPLQAAQAQPVVKEVKGPDADFVLMGYRAPGIKAREALVLKMIGKILYNGQAGLIDLNLQKKQKVLSAYAYAQLANDYSMLIMGGTPRKGQTPEQVRSLLLAQVELLKEGKFDDGLIPAIITDAKIRRMKSYESNSSRAHEYVNAFTSGIEWKDYLARDKQFETITRQEVMEVAGKLLAASSSVTVYKRNGKDPNQQKVDKPTITPIALNRETNSAFYHEVMSGETPAIEPVFLDFQKDIQQASLKQNIPLLYLQNRENGLFSLFYVLDMGTNNDPRLGLAVQYLRYLGDNKHSAEALQKEFFKIGCSFDVFTSPDQVYVSLSGLDENLEKGLALFENLLQNPKADKQALNDMVAGILKERADAKLNKDAILGAMVNYAKYGPKNPGTNILSEKELKALKPEQLLAIIKSLNGYKHRVMYYGPRPQRTLITALNANHRVPATLKPVPAERRFQQLAFNDNQVIWAHYDMVQAEIMILSKSLSYRPDLMPAARLFNEYFDGSMGGVVFQELRESKALAYAASSRYSTASRKDESNYMVSYIGTQADKLPEAMAGMTELLRDMPATESNLVAAKSAIRNSISSERITRSAILFEYERARKLGIDYDIRRNIYQGTNTMTMADLTKFQQQYVKDQKSRILVIGNRNRLNFKELGKYGKVKEVKLAEIFGY